MTCQKKTHPAFTLLISLAFGLLGFLAEESEAQNRGERMRFRLTTQKETSPKSGRFHQTTKSESWLPGETAIIVCDTWDSHHCLNAVRRVKDFAPRLNQVLKAAREKGVTIIHAPSDCMPFYKDHKARLRAIETPKSGSAPTGIESWCSRIPSEEKAAYPIDQSDGGEDDDPEEHKCWVKELEKMGRNPGTPWIRQTELITIDEKRDFISDRGDEVWNILAHRNIKNVILTGVHTNMCVLGRPFGIRNLLRGRKNVVLMRDLTDCMYNPRRWPFVDHFSGNDLVYDHIERYVCPTITSDQIIGGRPFRFKSDQRPHIVMLIGEKEYKTKETLPAFAKQCLRRDFKVSFVFAHANQRNHFPNIETVRNADLLLISVRRRALKKEALSIIREQISKGIPVIGIRTASHAFDIKTERPEGSDEWESFDQDVFGAKYIGHHSNGVEPTIKVVKNSKRHDILNGIKNVEFSSKGSLYKNKEFDTKATPLLSGEIFQKPQEAVAWTFERSEGGRSFYTSLGHPSDFSERSFRRMLFNAIHWGLKLETRELPPLRNSPRHHWTTVNVPHKIASKQNEQDPSETYWYRCLVKVDHLTKDRHFSMVADGNSDVRAFINGQEMRPRVHGNVTNFYSPRDARLKAGKLNLIVVRIDNAERKPPEFGLRSVPMIQFLDGSKPIQLEGRWQFRIGRNESYSKLPLPPKFAASTDIIFEK